MAPYQQARRGLRSRLLVPRLPMTMPPVKDPPAPLKEPPPPLPVGEDFPRTSHLLLPRQRTYQAVPGLVPNTTHSSSQPTPFHILHLFIHNPFLLQPLFYPLPALIINLLPNKPPKPLLMLEECQKGKGANVFNSFIH